MAFPYTFASLSGTVPAAYLDANFANCAEIGPFNTLSSAVAALPSSAIPLIPVAGGAAGTNATLSKSDHQHPPQDGTVNVQSGTTYTLQASDNGKIVEFTNAGAVTLTVPNSLAAGFNCGLCQCGAGQVTINAGAGATRRQASSLTKTRAQWSEVALRVRANSGGSAAEFVLSGDMA
jgi:hypothetical protein